MRTANRRPGEDAWLDQKMQLGFLRRKVASDRFKLNDNYGIGDKALVFHFNTYEIAAGAMGPTEIKIPYTDMRQLLKPDSGLQR